MQEVKLHFHKKNDFYMKEAFKTLRSNIEFCGEDIKVIAITSCMAHEGKSSIAMELAKSFAEAGNVTLLIDADMRKSVLIGRYKTGVVKFGLSHCLTGKHQYMDMICKTNVSHLYMLFAGPTPPNPSELLGSRKFTEMLNTMKRPFAYIIVDTPPLGSVIDAAVVAKSCDGTVLVIENNTVSYRFVQKVKEQLDKTGSRILGVVLNKVDMNSKGYYGHYGKYYGKYYGEYEEASESPEKQEEEELLIELQKEFHENQKREKQEQIEEKKKKEKKIKKEQRKIRKQKMKQTARNFAKHILVAILLIMLVCGLFLGGFETVKIIGKRRLQNSSNSVRPELQNVIDADALVKEEEIKWQDGWVKYQDTIYQYNQDILTFLIMGIDKNGDVTAVGESMEGGQADVLFLVVMNPKDKSIKIIRINRNTMSDINIYNGNGAYITTIKAQLALQHGFGNGMEKSCEYQKMAVEKLFYNLPIHGYAAIDMSAIPTINDAAGGIDVTVLEELTDLVNTAKEKNIKDISVVLNFYKAISAQMVTDISLDKTAYLASVLPNYKFDENSFYMMEGETVMGEELEEFYPDEDALYEMILDIFYEEVEQ